MMKSKLRLITIMNSMAANKKRTLWKWVCFGAYLLFLGYMLFYSALLGREVHSNYRYNLVLFQEIGRYYRLGIQRGSWNLFILNVIGNIMVFMPLGAFLPMLFKRCRNLFFTMILSMEVSLVVELIQLMTKVGSFDVDDLLLNTLGGVCGFLVYMLWRFVRAGYRRRK